MLSRSVAMSDLSKRTLLELMGRSSVRICVDMSPLRNASFSDTKTETGAASGKSSAGITETRFRICPSAVHQTSTMPMFSQSRPTLTTVDLPASSMNTSCSWPPRMTGIRDARSSCFAKNFAIALSSSTSWCVRGRKRSGVDPRAAFAESHTAAAVSMTGLTSGVLAGAYMDVSWLRKPPTTTVWSPTLNESHLGRSESSTLVTLELMIFPLW
mmetsp:Transcript_105530/g.336038  ORF Transcript_105530/g.336038 Transcript_105530/m.336038 type:complete len:213 (+) Transcript_105530:885-1523(+)